MGSGEYQYTVNALEKLYTNRIRHIASLPREKALELIASSYYVYTPVEYGGWGFIGDCWSMKTPIIATHNDYDLKNNSDSLITSTEKIVDTINKLIGRSGSHRFQRTFNERISKSKQVSYKGELRIEEVNRILAESHVLVNTSLYEGFPNTFIQAWMRKIPVISLNVDPDDMIKDNKIGFHSNTFEQLVTDTKTLIENNKLREQMAERAQRIAFEKFSMKNIEKVIDLIEYEQ